MSTFRSFLAQPLAQLLLGLVFLLLFTWPLFASDSAYGTWAHLYGSWAVAVAVIGASVWATPRDEEGV